MWIQFSTVRWFMWQKLKSKWDVSHSSKVKQPFLIFFAKKKKNNIWTKRKISNENWFHRWCHHSRFKRRKKPWIRLQNSFWIRTKTHQIVFPSISCDCFTFPHSFSRPFSLARPGREPGARCSSLHSIRYIVGFCSFILMNSIIFNFIRITIYHLLHSPWCVCVCQHSFIRHIPSLQNCVYAFGELLFYFIIKKNKTEKSQIES